LLNSPGIIDADYRGEIKAIMINLSRTPFTISNGMRIAQLIIVAYEQIQFIEGTTNQTSRADGGFGSTGLF
jgi:dUTP pyrophosphatase